MLQKEKFHSYNPVIEEHEESTKRQITNLADKKNNKPNQNNYLKEKKMSTKQKLTIDEASPFAHVLISSYKLVTASQNTNPKN